MHNNISIYRKEELMVEFDNVISYLSKFNIVCKERNNYLCDNKLFYEVLYWAIDIVLQNGGQIEDIKIEQVFDYISGASENLNRQSIIDINL